MSYLASSDRRILESSIRNARDAAEAAAAVSLKSLEVNVEKPKHIHTDDDLKLHKALQALKDQLGNYDELVGACAYEQWHRMLFARFLAENSLLLHPSGMCITLDECEELAREENVDVWDLAAEYASSMLPGIFKPTDPLMKVMLAPEGRQTLEKILDGIPQTVFTSDDGLGWVYQYWQAKNKEEVNKSERKISGSDICAVTQLFTESYMVQFLLQNTLGAWWLSLHVDSPLQEKWVYYKEKVQHDFSTWPKTVAEVRIIDPCCGSGHFLVEALNMLLDMYREESGMPDGDAAISAIKNNLFGLEIDPRCTQIAAFALALTAWKAGMPTDNLSIPNIACCGLPLGASKKEWKAIANGDTRLSQVLAGMHDLFTKARELGSLIDASQLEVMKWYNMSLDDLRDHLETAFSKENVSNDPAASVFGEAIKGAIRAFELLSSNYHIVVTNPPFLLKTRQANTTREYCERSFAVASKDLATCFIERCCRLAFSTGHYALVTPQNWLFLGADKQLRKKLLHEQTFRVIARLGARAFETITGEVVQVALCIFSNLNPSEDSVFYAIDCSGGATAPQKAELLATGGELYLHQLAQGKNPDSRIILDEMNDSTLLSMICGRICRYPNRRLHTIW